MNEDDLRLMVLRLRKLYGSQKALAQAIGVSENNLSRFVAGKQTSFHFRRMQEALGAHITTVRIIKPDIEL